MTEAPSRAPLAHPEIDAARLVDRYLAGRLDEDTEARFEEHLFACADCLDAVEAGEDLRRGLRDVATEDAARAEVGRRVAAVGLLAWLGRRGVALGALALVLAAASVVLWQQREIGRLRSAEAPATGLAAPTGALQVVALGVLRDGTDDAEVEITVDPTAETVLLSLDTPAWAVDRYRIRLQADDGREPWVSEGLAPSLYGTLLVAVPASYLEPGRYRVSVEPVGGSAEQTAEIRVRVR